MTTIAGTYKDGKLELLEKPPEGQEGSVLVIFLDKPINTISKPDFISKGMFAGPIKTTEEDFKLAEWHPKENDL